MRGSPKRRAIKMVNPMTATRTAIPPTTIARS
jgi:hypothetical protein